MLPDGSTVLSDGMTLWYTHVPNFFTILSSSISNLTTTTSDIDGDLGDTPIFGTPILFWSQSNGSPFTTQQLANWMGSFFNGQQVKLVIKIPVTARTVFGDPRVASTATLFEVGSYTLNIPPIISAAAIHVSDHTFAGNVGFPSTGFDGAYFQIQANEGGIVNNANYMWQSSNTGFASVSNDGSVVLRQSGLTGNHISVYAVPKGAGPLREIHFRISRWFLHDGGPAIWNDAKTHCASFGTRLPWLAELTNSTADRVAGWRNVGSLWPEWGPQTAWRGSRSSYWSADYNPTESLIEGIPVGYYVFLDDQGKRFDGRVGISATPGSYANGYVRCVMDL